MSGAEGLAAFTGSVFLDADEPPLRPPHDPLCAYPRQHAGRSWRSHTGRLVCGVCHPPSHPSLIAEAAADE